MEQVPYNRRITARVQLVFVACAAVLAAVFMLGAVGCQTGDSAASEQTGQSSQSESASATSAADEAPTSSSSSSAANEAEEEAMAIPVVAFDDLLNPTFAAVLELNGKELRHELESADYVWDDEGTAWYRAEDDAMLFAEGPNGTLGYEDATALPRGAVGKDVSYAFTVQGYETPADALSDLASELTIEKRLDSADVSFAVVLDQGAQKFLVAVVDDGRGGYIGLTFSDSSIAAGLFQRLISADADTGNTVATAWRYCVKVY